MLIAEIKLAVLQIHLLIILMLGIKRKLYKIITQLTNDYQIKIKKSDKHN